MNETETDSGAARARRALPMTLVVLATVLAFVSVFAIWAKRQLLETDTWTHTSSRLLENEDIRNAVSDFLVTQLYANVDVQGELSKRMPADLKPLSGPASAGLRELALNLSQRALAQPRVQGLWEEANRTAHEEFLAVVDNKNEAVSTTGGNVVLDLGTILTKLANQVGVGGNIASKVPPDAAQITIMRSDQLEEVQTGVRLLRTLAWLLTAIAIALYALAIYLARDRRRQILRSVGIAFLAVGVLVLFVRGLAGDYVVGALTTTAASEPAAHAAWSIGTSQLVEIAQDVVIYGLVIILAAWLAGPHAAATWVRRGITPYLRQPRVAYGALAVFLVLIFWWGPIEGTRRLVPSLVLIAFLVLGIEILRRQVIWEFPDRVTTGSAEGLAQRIANRMRDARERRAAFRGGAAPQPPAEQRVAQLERLGQLRDSGVLSSDEFAAEKKRILETP
ncbi:MAG: SHOCT domain-containing protein [Solirubrobacterales bacterium]